VYLGTDAWIFLEDSSFLVVQEKLLEMEDEEKKLLPLEQAAQDVQEQPQVIELISSLIIFHPCLLCFAYLLFFHFFAFRDSNQLETVHFVAVSERELQIWLRLGTGRILQRKDVSSISLGIVSFMRLSQPFANPD